MSWSGTHAETFLVIPLAAGCGDGDTVLTRYFERGEFEYHPESPAGFRVLLRRLGAGVLADRGW
jgi:hypothetical protein